MTFLVALLVLAAVYGLWILGYKWTTGHISNPVAEEDPIVAASMNKAEIPTEEDLPLNESK